MSTRKIGIIGAGHVGSHGGYALISQSGTSRRNSLYRFR